MTSPIASAAVLPPCQREHAFINATLNSDHSFVLCPPSQAWGSINADRSRVFSICAGDFLKCGRRCPHVEFIIG